MKAALLFAPFALSGLAWTFLIWLEGRDEDDA